METTKSLYERAKSVANCRSDYEFAKRYELKTPTVSRWANGKATFDDESAELIAVILKIDPEYIMAVAHGERAKTERSKSRWLRIAALVAAAALPPAAGAAGHNANYGGQTFAKSLNDIYIMRLRKLLFGRQAFA